MIDTLKMVVRGWHYRLQENPTEIGFIMEYAKKGDTLFDIGSNKGGFLYWMVQKAGLTGKVIGFEPQRVLFEYLKNYYASCLAPQIKIESYALSDIEEETTMIIPDNGKPSAPGASIHFTLADSPTARTATVQTTTLDLYCAKNELVPKLIKIDVEGNELKVIRGGKGVLLANKPRIILECESIQVGRATVQETFEELLSLGYDGYFYYKGTRIGIRDFVADQHQPEKYVGKKSREYCSNFFFI